LALQLGEDGVGLLRQLVTVHLPQGLQPQLDVVRIGQRKGILLFFLCMEVIEEGRLGLLLLAFDGLCHGLDVVEAAVDECLRHLDGCQFLLNLLVHSYYRQTIRVYFRASRWAAGVAL
jgi:hypothetical protein